MDIQDRSPQQEPSDEQVNSNLVITITMKKMDSGAGSSAWEHNNNNNNNNDGSVKIVKKESAAKEFCKNLFNKSSSSSSSSSSNGDKNNNNNNSQPAPVTNQYTKVTVDGLMSQLTFHQNRQMSQLAQHGNAVAVNQIDASMRHNSTIDEHQLDDSDERARAQRAFEIREGVEMSPKAEASSTSLSSMLTRSEAIQQSRPDATQSRLAQDSCMKCQHNQAQIKTFGMAQTSMLPLADGEVPKFHSQDYYYHFLVPDLEKITACCYYWGKMDRYEAEKLLDGKPEGTFLLRDSAQDDYLFSVSFRKYGRSLHARIEQWNHKFSFDSHDPSVYTATTVTGLVEHYKDPTSVMFFEPMLTSPLHRNYVFSLQQLCRAAIVSHTTYDGINDLCLPPKVKSYLKEYHYKLKVRVRQYPEGMTNLPSSS